MANTYFSATGVNDALAGFPATGYISLHTASPGTTGASEVSGGAYARVATTWAAASAGSRTGSQVTVNVPASTTITHFGIWDAATGGNYLGGGPLSASETFAAAGAAQVTPALTAQG